MQQQIKREMLEELQGFDLPSYHEIPNIGLFLEQTTKYIAEYLAPLETVTLTGSMISNYVKKGLIKNPVKKQYTREQIAYLFFIAVAKTVLSLEDIQQLIKLQENTYDCEKAYNYFRQELKDILAYVFGIKEELTAYTSNNMDEKSLLRNTIIAVAHKVYLDKYFKILRNS
ncbi:MAG: DUF1836 domain-containing protein [Eubacteriales bacterium]|nr:DUF1836 domain-containing protein [Eubacteriales bacterium]